MKVKEKQLKCSFCNGTLGLDQTINYGNETDHYRKCLNCGYEWNSKYYSWLDQVIK